MRLTFQRAVCALVLGTAAFATPAFATTNLFVPISGAQINQRHQNYPGVISHTGGTVANIAGPPDSFDWVEASLGHAGGGNHGWWLRGSNNGSSMPCDVIAIDAASGAVSVASTNITVVGSFNVFVNINAAGTDVYYSLECRMPTKNSSNWPNDTAKIYGAIPNG